MMSCDDFMTFLVEDEAELEPAVRDERDLHARTCHECGRVLKGYRAFVACREAERAGTVPREELERFDPVKPVVMRAAREAIAARKLAERTPILERRTFPVRMRAVAVAATTVVGVALATYGPAVQPVVDHGAGVAWDVLPSKDKPLADVGSFSVATVESATRVEVRHDQH